MNLWSFLLVIFAVLVGVDFWLLYEARQGDDAANFVLGLSVASTFIVIGFFLSEFSQWAATRRIQAQQDMHRSKESVDELYQSQKVMGGLVRDSMKMSGGLLQSLRSVRSLPSPGENRPFDIDDESLWDESGLNIDGLNINYTESDQG